MRFWIWCACFIVPIILSTAAKSQDIEATLSFLVTGNQQFSPRISANIFSDASYGDPDFIVTVDPSKCIWLATQTKDTREEGCHNNSSIREQELLGLCPGGVCRQWNEGFCNSSRRLTVRKRVRRTIAINFTRLVLDEVRQGFSGGRPALMLYGLDELFCDTRQVQSVVEKDGKVLWCNSGSDIGRAEDRVKAARDPDSCVSEERACVAETTLASPDQNTHNRRMKALIHLYTMCKSATRKGAF